MTVLSLHSREKSYPFVQLCEEKTGLSLIF
jgi:hypothetical protein